MFTTIADFIARVATWIGADAWVMVIIILTLICGFGAKQWSLPIKLAGLICLLWAGCWLLGAILPASIQLVVFILMIIGVIWLVKG